MQKLILFHVKGKKKLALFQDRMTLYNDRHVWSTPE